MYPVKQFQWCGWSLYLLHVKFQDHMILGNVRKEIFSTVSQCTMSNLCLNLIFSVSDILVKATMMGAFKVKLFPIAAAVSLWNRIIAWLCTYIASMDRLHPNYPSITEVSLA